LLVAAIVAAPLFLYLAAHPGLEARVTELSAPLRAAAGGEFAPLWGNARGALRLFTIEGDQTWRYNIPGKPFLGPVMGALFYAGLLVAGWLAWTGLRDRNRPLARATLADFPRPAAPGAFLALVWLALGFAPVLVTGPGLSMTQAIGAMPVLYVFPALALVVGYSRITNYELRITNEERRAGRLIVVCGLAAAVLFAALAIQTARDYFGRWANAPEVRVQYETAMVAALRYLDAHGTGAAAVSTITPGRYHTPAVALLTLHNPTVRPRWFDGRESLLFPAEAGGTLVVPGFTPLPAELQRYLDGATLVDELPMRPDDLDRPVRVYRLNGSGYDVARTTTALRSQGFSGIVEFPPNAALLGYELSAQVARPGDTLSLVTAWRLEEPLPDASLFAHLVGPDGRPVAQADGLGAPGEAWVLGDVLLQLHTIQLPDDTPAGVYPLTVGLYIPDGGRLPTGDGLEGATLTTVLVLDE
jgi:hypothetical protein